VQLLLTSHVKKHIALPQPVSLVEFVIKYFMKLGALFTEHAERFLKSVTMMLSETWINGKLSRIHGEGHYPW